MMLLKNLYLLLVIILLSGCSQKLPVREYLKWVEDENNGLLVKQNINGNSLILQYQPLEYVALLDLRQKKADEGSIRAEVSGLNGYYYFSFKIKPSVPVDANQDYFNYQMENRFLLIQGNDSVKCAFYHLESTRNFSPYLTFILAFKKEKVYNENIIFQYSDEYFGLKIIKIEIDKTKLKNIPSLKFE